LDRTHILTVLPRRRGAAQPGRWGVREPATYRRVRRTRFRDLVLCV